MQHNVIITGIGILLLLGAIVWFIMKWNVLSEFERLVAFILICIFIAIVIVVHYVLDMYDDFNILIGKWNYVEGPINRIRNIFQ